MYSNFGRVHKTLRVTPAMQAGIADHVWSLEEIAALVQAPVVKKRGPYRKTDRNLTDQALKCLISTYQIDSIAKSGGGT